MRRLQLKERAIALLGGKCVICGYDKCPAAFDFHHMDPTQKDFVISSKMSWEAIVEELKKCVLVCANCHREINVGWHPGYLLSDEGGSYGEDFDETSSEDEIDSCDTNFGTEAGSV